MRDDLLEHAMRLAGEYAMLNALCELEGNWGYEDEHDALKVRRNRARTRLRAFLDRVFTAAGLELDEGDLLVIDRSGKWHTGSVLLRGLVRGSDGGR